MTEPKKATEIVDMEPVALPAPVAFTPVDQGSTALMRMIEKAMMDPAFDVAKMEHLLGVKERWDANEARKAFVLAMAAFKADPPKIVKDRHVRFDTQKGVTEYDHATIGQVCDAVAKGLADHGMSHDWDIEQGEGDKIKVTCIITHVQGHEKRVCMKAGPDASGGKNMIQQTASTVTYLERYTLLAATGLAPIEKDMDGAGPVDLISAEQKESLVNLSKEVGGDTVRFLKYLRIDTLDDLPASRYFEAQTALEAKRKVKE